MTELQPQDVNGGEVATGSQLLVTDLSAISRHSQKEAQKDYRTHDILVADKRYSYTFKPGEPIAMPYEHGIKFLQEGWRVETADGQEYVPPPAQPGQHDRIVLKADQVVASLDELTREALKLRVGRIPGGEGVAKGNKENLIAFLVHHTQMTMEHPVAEADEMSPAFLDSLVPA